MQMLCSPHVTLKGDKICKVASWKLQLVSNTRDASEKKIVGLFFDALISKNSREVFRLYYRLTSNICEANSPPLGLSSLLTQNIR